MTKLATRRGTPKRTVSSSSFGRAASLLAVEKAVNAGSRMALMNPKIGTRNISITGTKTRTNRQKRAR